MASGTYEILQDMTPTYTSFTQDLYTVEKITDDAWNWGVTGTAGALSVARDSKIITQLADGTNSGFFLESGPVADQTFAGGSATSNPTLYIGGSDYSTIYNPNGLSEIQIAPNADGTFQLDSVGFGQMTFDTSTPPAPTQAFFNDLGYPNQPQSAIIATDFMGLGLPDYLWYQLTNLLYKVDSNIASELHCTDESGGKCKLDHACATYTNLWTAGWSLKVQFTGSTNYAIFPLGALAVDNAQNECEIFIQYLDDMRHSQSSQVVFGSMFLQQYAVNELYDLSANTTSLKMYLSSTCTLNTPYIGAATYTALTDPFTLLHDTTQEVYINTDLYQYQTTIGADLGFQGRVQFKVSLLGQAVYAWD